MSGSGNLERCERAEERRAERVRGIRSTTGLTADLNGEYH